MQHKITNILTLNLIFKYYFCRITIFNLLGDKPKI
jgi:hypothetical protein